MKNKSKLYMAVSVQIALWIILILGWVLNIVQLCKVIAAPITGVFIVKVAGIIIAPLGAIMGYIGLF